MLHYDEYDLVVLSIAEKNITGYVTIPPENMNIILIEMICRSHFSYSPADIVSGAYRIPSRPSIVCSSFFYIEKASSTLYDVSDI